MALTAEIRFKHLRTFNMVIPAGKEQNSLMATPLPTLPDALMGKLEVLARCEGRSVGEVLAEAIEKYVDSRHWQDLLDKADRRAKAMGLTEEDVPRLIAESRAERGLDH